MGKKSLSPTFNIHSTFTNVHVHLPSMTLLRNRKIEVTIFAQLPTATLEEIHRPAQGNYRSIWHLNRNTVNVLLETISGSHLFTCWPLAWASFEKTQVHNMPSGLMHGAKNGKKVTWPVTWILQVITKNDHKCLTLHKACERHSFLTTILLSEYTRIIYIHIYVCIYIHIQVKNTHISQILIDLWTISPPAGNAKTRHHTWSRCKKRAWGNLRPFGSPRHQHQFLDFKFEWPQISNQRSSWIQNGNPCAQEPLPQLIPVRAASLFPPNNLKADHGWWKTNDLTAPSPCLHKNEGGMATWIASWGFLSESMSFCEIQTWSLHR